VHSNKEILGGAFLGNIPDYFCPFNSLPPNKMINCKQLDIIWIRVAVRLACLVKICCPEIKCFCNVAFLSKI
jgi:hypothetical protein